MIEAPKHSKFEGVVEQLHARVKFHLFRFRLDRLGQEVELFFIQPIKPLVRIRDQVVVIDYFEAGHLSRGD